MRYSDAVKMLGGGESKLLAFLDDASSVALLGLEKFDLFEAKREAVRLADKALKGLGKRLRGLNALTRTERLTAAHWIIIITAFFEAVDEHLEAVGIKDLGASAAEQVTLIADTYPGEASMIRVGRSLASHLLPDIHTLYQARSQRILEHLEGLAVFESLDPATREAVHGMRDSIAATAVLRYEERLRELAGDCDEFTIWLNLSSHARTVEEVRRVHSGLARLESLFTDLSSTQTPHPIHSALYAAYRAQLNKPITQQASSDLKVPTLEEGYIDHRYRVATSHPTANPAQEDWWKYRPVLDDLGLYLASHLVSDAAQRTPLLVLGHPGSGKSVLTRVLAARLPADRFLPVRVELRSVDANSDLQTQIEEAIRLTTTESIRWPDLVRDAPEAMPVVLLDGFDELLQATGVAQTDFLERVSQFQERELDQGRAVAVVVTSRIAVADRARIPAETTVLCLEPFDVQQIKAWLEIWGEHNESILAERDLQPLSADVALRHKQLAEQPLMLLMLALYDASANALGTTENFGRAALYEALLTDFARREVSREGPGPATDDEIERELTQLSVVAFAMFNRQAQWATDEDVTADLIGLRLAASRGAERRLRKPLTAGQLAFGRFFFIHDTQVTRDGEIAQTYEFLHATFGEFLIARFVATLVAHLARAHSRSSSVLPSAAEDGRLHALLSFECLAARTPITEFLASLIAPDPQLAELLVEAFAESLDERSDSAFANYRPAALSIVQRHANWSANLLLLAAIAAGSDGMTASRLFAGADDPADKWRNTALLWRGQLTHEGRNGLVRLLDVQRVRRGPVREIAVRFELHQAVTPSVDLGWTYDVDDIDVVLPTDEAGWMRRKHVFTAATGTDMVEYGIEPITAAMPGLAHAIVRLPGARLVTPTRVLLAAVAALGDPASDGEAFGDLVAMLDVIFKNRHIQWSPDADAFVPMAIGTLRAAAQAGLMPERFRHRTSNLPRIGSGLGVLSKNWRRLEEALNLLLAEDPTPTKPTPPAPAASPPPEPSPATSSPETPATPPTAP